jgi:hypothetical protein
VIAPAYAHRIRLNKLQRGSLLQLRYASSFAITRKSEAKVNIIVL